MNINGMQISGRGCVAQVGGAFFLFQLESTLAQLADVAS